MAQERLLQLITSKYSVGEEHCYSNTAKPEDGSYHESIMISVKAVVPISLAITVPLNELDITRLKTYGEQLEPYAWVFNARDVSFSKHRFWGIFREAILNDAWKRLFPFENKPTLKLQKLLLCGPGSRLVLVFNSGSLY